MFLDSLPPLPTRHLQWVLYTNEELERLNADLKQASLPLSHSQYPSDVRAQSSVTPSMLGDIIHRARRNSNRATNVDLSPLSPLSPFCWTHSTIKITLIFEHRCSNQRVNEPNSHVTMRDNTATYLYKKNSLQLHGVKRPFNPFKPESTIVIYIHHRTRIAV